MSFTGEIKTELSKLNLDKLEAISELSGILRGSMTIDNGIKITTENSAVARCVFNLIRDLYGVRANITVRHGYNYNKHYMYILLIEDKYQEIIIDLCLNKNIPDSYIVDDDLLIKAYLRGVFLSSGSVNDPKKSRYHLEISVDDKEYALFIQKLMNKYDLNAKILGRDNRWIIYIKEAEKIGDFLRLMNSINTLFYYEDILIQNLEQLKKEKKLNY